MCDEFFSLALTEHGIEPYEMAELSQQALCHHILNGLCAISDRSECRAVAGTSHACKLAFLITESPENLVTRNLIDLHLLQCICSGLGIKASGKTEQTTLLAALTERKENMHEANCLTTMALFLRFERLSKILLLNVAAGHGITTAGTIESLRREIISHITKGHCSHLSSSIPNCEAVSLEAPDTTATPMNSKLLSWNQSLGKLRQILFGAFSPLLTLPSTQMQNFLSCEKP